MAGNAQRRYTLIPVRIPYSAALNETFGQGSANVGAPLKSTATDFKFTSNLCPLPGEYTIVNKSICSTWIQPKFCNFHGPLKNPAYWDNYFFRPEDSSGYVMYVNNTHYNSRRILYTDTVSNLCGGSAYHFFASIIYTLPPSSTCNGPDFTFEVLTLSGMVLQSYRAKDVDYSSKFIMPPAESKCIVTIYVEPFPSTVPTVYCPSEFAVDDIQVIPFGPQPTINIAGYDSLKWVIGTCFQSTTPVVLNSAIEYSFTDPFSRLTNTIHALSNAAYQWEKSNDYGLSWSDIPGASNPTFSQIFSTPDTLLIRLRIGEAANISNKNCSMVSNIIEVQVDDAPKNYTIASNSPVCAGQNLQFNAEGGASYIWRGPNGFFDNIAYPHISNASLKDSGTYYVWLYSWGGCYVKDSVHVVMIGTDVHGGADTAICKGRYVKLTASKGESYIWSPAAGLSSTNNITTIAKPEVTTTYTVKVTDKFGCSDTASVIISILNNNEVKAGIAATGYICRAYDSVYFADNSTGNIAKWQWDFGNGQTSIAAKPGVQNYQVQAGKNSYAVKLTVADSTGCTDSTVHILNVVDNCYIAVPNAFTPNGDGVNDYLYPINAYKATNLLFNVYNRLGELVFTTTDMNNKWDGRRLGAEQSAGAYIWILQYNDAAGKKVFLKGTTILIR